MIRQHRIAAGRTDWALLEAGAGPPVLFLHGWPEFSAVWERLLVRLAPDFRCIAPDLPGFGASSDPNGGAPAADVGPGELARDLLGLLDALGLPRVAVVAHDIGGFVVQAMARAAAGRISRIVLFDCASPGIGAGWRDADRVNEIWYQSFHQMPFAAALVGATRETCRAYFGWFLRHWAAREDAFAAADVERWVDVHMAPGRIQAGFNWYRSVNAARLAVMDGRAPALPPIAVPTRCLWPERDRLMKPAWAAALHGTFADLSLGSIAAGHFPHWEVPDLAAAEIRAFLAMAA